MKEKIIDKETAEHYVWGDNCDSWVLADTPGLSVKQESMPGLTREKLHFHTNAQQFFIAAVEKMEATYEQVENWLEQELASFFDNDHMTQTINYGNWIKFIQRAT
jgi:hypothetical protein